MNFDFKPAILLLLITSFVSIQADDYFEIPVNSPKAQGINDIDYNSNLMFFENEIGPEVLLQTRLNLEIKNEWVNPYFGAFANYTKSAYSISLWGGMARAALMTNEVMLATLCHEAGHILGGLPKQTIIGSSWASSEGQSDFYAAKVCLPLLMKKYPLKFRHSSVAIEKRCQGDINCQKIASIGFEFIKFLQKWTYSKQSTASLNVLPKEVVSSTLINNYPSDQCRLETFIAGAICSNPQLKCERPRCWYHP